MDRVHHQSTHCKKVAAGSTTNSTPEGWWVVSCGGGTTQGRIKKNPPGGGRDIVGETQVYGYYGVLLRLGDDGRKKVRFAEEVDVRDRVSSLDLEERAPAHLLESTER